MTPWTLCRISKSQLFASSLPARTLQRSLTRWQMHRVDRLQRGISRWSARWSISRKRSARKRRPMTILCTYRLRSLTKIDAWILIICMLDAEHYALANGLSGWADWLPRSSMLFNLSTRSPVRSLQSDRFSQITPVRSLQIVWWKRI